MSYARDLALPVLNPSTQAILSFVTCFVPLLWFQ
jgi:hypothetical protein